MTANTSESPSRRALLAAGLGALGATVVSAVGLAEPADAASSVILGGSNTEAHATTIKNSSSSTSVVAIQGVLSHSHSSHGSAAVKGEDDGIGGMGVYGVADHGSAARGVYGHSHDGVSVYGSGTTGVQASGSTYGVSASGGSYGFYAPNVGSYGFYGSGTTSGADFFGGPWGAYAVGTNYGIEGIANGTSGSKYGVYGYASGAGTNYGVYGSAPYAGIYGSSAYVGTWGGDASSLPTYGVVGYGASYGVWGTAPTGSSRYALYGLGDGKVTGSFSKAAGSFQIDHPLDPEHKWLRHSFVESPDMMNVYNGNAVLNARGEAVVTLPKYFGVLNRDYRYQLTAIGGAAPSLHIAQKVTRNRFRIAGGSAGLEVSWQVTGIRQDDYAKEHPIVVETRKTKAERGTRQFVPKGSSAKLMRVAPRHVPTPKHMPHPQPLHARQP